MHWNYLFSPLFCFVNAIAVYTNQNSVAAVVYIQYILYDNALYVERAPFSPQMFPFALPRIYQSYRILIILLFYFYRNMNYHSLWHK